MAQGWFDRLRAMLDTFVYVARPEEPGPEGRRTLAMFAHGAIHVTAERRVPTTKDPALGADR